MNWQQQDSGTSTSSACACPSSSPSFQATLPGSRDEGYLRHRDIPLALAQQYGVGYAAPGTWPHAARDWRGGRVVFPHTTPDGHLVNLYGRAVGTAAQVPKGASAMIICLVRRATSTPRHCREGASRCGCAKAFLTPWRCWLRVCHGWWRSWRTGLAVGLGPRRPSVGLCPRCRYGRSAAVADARGTWCVRMSST